MAFVSNSWIPLVAAYRWGFLVALILDLSNHWSGSTLTPQRINSRLRGVFSRHRESVIADMGI